MLPAHVEALGSWSPWVPFDTALDTAPRTPGVYLARSGDGSIVYVGMAGERRGTGLRGRLSVYASGKAAVSGLGEAAFNRALADPAWVRDRLADLDAGRPLTAKQWAQAALQRAQLWLCWTQTTDRTSALALEKAVIIALQDTPLWNTRR